MAEAKSGDRVRVHYTGLLQDGSVFDTSEGFVDECADGGGDSRPTGPLEFIIGGNTLIPGFEAAVIGLKPGQGTRVFIPADEAYGQRAEEMVAVVERSELPPDINPEPGQQMEVILQDGSPLPVVVTGVTDTTITLDANHPLAGSDLTFDIRLLEIL
jgi:peptidylprolyl isomerase